MPTQFFVDIKVMVCTMDLQTNILSKYDIAFSWRKSLSGIQSENLCRNYKIGIRLNAIYYQTLESRF